MFERCWHLLPRAYHLQPGVPLCCPHAELPKDAEGSGELWTLARRPALSWVSGRSRETAREDASDGGTPSRHGKDGK